MPESGLGFGLGGGGVPLAIPVAAVGVAAVGGIVGAVDAEKILDPRGEMARFVGVFFRREEIPPFLIRHVGRRAGSEKLRHADRCAWIHRQGFLFVLSFRMGVETRKGGNQDDNLEEKRRKGGKVKIGRWSEGGKGGRRDGRYLDHTG